jgi:hypothetical protein
MIDKLPYTLTKGVVATREGLTGDVERIGRLLDLTPERETDPPIVYWPDAAERLRYREGEPYCELYIGELGRTGFLRCEPPFTNPGDDCIALHRLTAILADDVEAFRVLHWCVTELGGNDD